MQVSARIVRFIACYSIHLAVSHALLIICFSEEGFLENIQFDHASSVPLSTQARDGMSLLSKHCLEFLQNAQAKRLIRVREAKEEHVARIEEEEEERRQREEKQRLREIEVSTLMIRISYRLTSSDLSYVIKYRKRNAKKGRGLQQQSVNARE